MSSQEKLKLIEALGRVVMRWQDTTQKFDEQVGELYGLNASERLCLSFLYGGPQSASAIAREVRLTPAAVTALIDRLEKRGFVRRRADPADRRRVMVEAADEAMKLTREIYLPLGQAGAESLASYSKSELRLVMKVLEEAIDIQERVGAELLGRVKPATE